jgi:RHS repeat-associated protein
MAYRGTSDSAASRIGRGRCGHIIVLQFNIAVSWTTSGGHRWLIVTRDPFPRKGDEPVTPSRSPTRAKTPPPRAPGGLQLHTEAPDAGARWTLPNVLGAPLRLWDARQHRFRWTYDPVSRPTHAYVKHHTDDELLRERTVYGESLGELADATNHRGQVYAHYDTAGELVFDAYDFKQNLLQQTRRFAADYTAAPDWSDLVLETVPQDIHDAADPLLDAETFETAWTYDALGRVVTHTTPDQSVTQQTYSPRGLVSALAVKIRGAGAATDIVTAVAYNARGQRLRVDAANDVFTNFEYDPTTFRVRRIHTERPHSDPDLRRVQDLRYHYDPVGNITRIRDLAQAGVFFDNAYADPTQSFTYDPLYRLTQATGREHDALPQPTAEGFAPIAHPQDTQAQRNYLQTYTYDPAGNILRMKHSSGGVTVWHRGYTYATTGNRLLATTLPGDDLEDPEDYSEPYTHDAHGNMTAMPTIPGGLTWDPQDRLIKTDHQGGGVTYYVYDSAGQRVRKVHLNQAATISTERYYLGPWETYKKTTDLQGTPTLDTERETLHVHTPAGADCLIETKTVEDETPLGTPTPLLRYQHHNHLGTATLELSQDAEVITYEEYHPYGTSAYRAANSAIEASPKRYRYTGKERDEETGLYYHEARYYACWLARWTAADPIGLQGGPNRFAYANNNPLTFNDPGGTSPADSATRYINEGTKADFGQKQYTNIEDAVLAAADVAVAAAEADHVAYRGEKATLQEAAATARGTLRDKRAESANAFFSFRWGELRALREARGKAKGDRAIAEQRLEEKRGESDLRGHDVEWSTVVYQDESGAYRVSPALPGGPRTVKDGKTTQAAMDFGNHLIHGTPISSDNIRAEIHTHPRWGDPLQADPRDVHSGTSTRTGLRPSSGDLDHAGATRQDHARRFFVVNPRGSVQEYNAKGPTGEPLRKGMSDTETLRAKASGTFGAVLKAHDNSAVFDALVDAASSLLSPSRSDLLILQRKVLP